MRLSRLSNRGVSPLARRYTRSCFQTYFQYDLWSEPLQNKERQNPPKNICKPYLKRQSRRCRDHSLSTSLDTLQDIDPGSSQQIYSTGLQGQVDFSPHRQKIWQKLDDSAGQEEQQQQGRRKLIIVEDFRAHRLHCDVSKFLNIFGNYSSSGVPLSTLKNCASALDSR